MFSPPFTPAAQTPQRYSQSLDGSQGGEEAFADGLQLIVVQRQQVEVLQVLEGVHSQTVDLVGVQQPETQTVG